MQQTIIYLSSNYCFPAIRILGAVQFLGYSKLLRLASPNDQALGQFITFVANDHERIQVHNIEK